jgi:hypothetical protein
MSKIFYWFSAKELGQRDGSYGVVATLDGGKLFRYTGSSNDRRKVSRSRGDEYQALESSQAVALVDPFGNKAELKIGSGGPEHGELTGQQGAAIGRSLPFESRPDTRYPGFCIAHPYGYRIASILFRGL